MKRILICFLILISLFACKKKQNESNLINEELLEEKYYGTVMVYSSMKKQQLKELKNSFEEHYKGITLDYYYSSEKNIISKVVEENANGGIIADIIWLDEPLDFEVFKTVDFLKNISDLPIKTNIFNYFNEYVDTDNFYLTTHLIPYGIIWNASISSPSDIPKNWNDLINEEYNGSVISLNPHNSSLSRYFVGLLAQNDNYGLPYFTSLKNNNFNFSFNNNELIEAINDNRYKYAIAPKNISFEIMKNDTNIKFNEINDDSIVAKSTIGIVNECSNLDNAVHFINFILSDVGQNIIASYNLIPLSEIANNNNIINATSSNILKEDFTDLNSKIAYYLEKFDEIFNN